MFNWIGLWSSELKRISLDLRRITCINKFNWHFCNAAERSFIIKKQKYICIVCTNYGIPLYRNVWRTFAVKCKNNLIWLPFKSFEHFSKTLLILSAKLSVPARTRRVGFGCGCPHLDSTAVMNCWKFILPQGPLLLLLFDDARRAVEDLDLY